MKLAIISHTEHYCSDDDTIYGWGATVREINYLANGFNEVYHIAPQHNGDDLKEGLLPYQGDNIFFVPLKPSGGKGLFEKLSVLFWAVHNIRVTREILKKVDVFQFRAPTGMGLYMIPWLYFVSRKRGWVKYAGNWQQKSPPWGYALQRWMLKKMTGWHVTINGAWNHQPKHCLSFENPCLTLQERDEGKGILNQKDYDGVLNFCFIGRLEDAKGVGVIIEAFKLLRGNKRVGKIHFIGDGPKKDKYLIDAESIKDNCVFHGFVKRTHIAEILSACHVFLLPSASEGFPKVVAEAANYGCIPIVTDVSCLSQYITEGMNGLLIPEDRRTGDMLKMKIDKLILYSDLKQMAFNSWDLSRKFTFDYYNQRVQTELI